MKRSFLFLILLLFIATACDDLIGAVIGRHGRLIHNNSNQRIFVVEDVCPEDGVITPDSWGSHVDANDDKFFESIATKKRKIEKKIKDSVHFYIIDHRLLPFTETYLRHLSEEDVDSIPEEALLIRITLTKKEYLDSKPIYYPSTNNDKVVYY